MAQISRIWETVKVNPFSKKRGLSWSPSLFPALIVRVRLWYAMDMPRVRKQLSRCRACGRQSRENPTPHAYPQARRDELLHASQERSSLRGLTRTFGISRTTVSSWIKTKELNFLPDVQPCSPRIPKIPRPRPWNPLGCGRLCSTKPRRSGCGWPCAARRDKWWPLRLGIGAGKTCQRL